MYLENLCLKGHTHTHTEDKSQILGKLNVKATCLCIMQYKTIKRYIIQIIKFFSARQLSKGRITVT